MLTDWAFRLRSLFKRGAVEQELDAELRFHLEQLVASYLCQGFPQQEALRRARLEFGGLDQIKEEHRDARGIRLLDDLVRDMRYALRQLKRSPGFASLAVLCLALGIGVNTAVFGVLNSILLRPMAVSDPERLIMVSRGQTATFSYPTYRDFQVRSHTLSGLTASFPMESDLDVDGQSEFVTAEVVSSNYGGVIGISPVLGRWFEDDKASEAVISHAVWQRRFDFSPDVLGRQIGSESQSYTIVGVAPDRFTGLFAPFRTDIWVPIRTRPGLAAGFENRRRQLVMVFGRLAREATAVQASAELNTIDAQLIAEHGAPSERRSPIVAEPVRGIPSPGGRRISPHRCDGSGRRCCAGAADCMRQCGQPAAGSRSTPPA